MIFNASKKNRVKKEFFVGYLPHRGAVTDS